MNRIAARLQRAGLHALVTLVVVMLERRIRKATGTAPTARTTGDIVSPNEDATESL
jgi:hypothetical protein